MKKQQQVLVAAWWQQVSNLNSGLVFSQLLPFLFPLIIFKPCEVMYPPSGWQVPLNLLQFLDFFHILYNDVLFLYIKNSHLHVIICFL